MGCAYVGMCLLPLEYSHHVLGSEPPAPEVEAKYTARDRPVSIVTWAHAASPDGPSGRPEVVELEQHLGIDSWVSCMELSYKAPWPLPLVITQSSLMRYNQLFKMLLAFRYVHLDLQHVQMPRSEQLGWALRAQLSYFVSQVLLYFHQDVIEASHRRLLQNVGSFKDFDLVVCAHEEFLTTCISHCFLKTPELHDALMTALRIASLFCLVVAPSSSASACRRPGSRNAEFCRLQQAFSGAVRSVLRMMNSMHRLGMHTHLAQLLLRLDYNGYFSGDADE